MTLDEAIRHAEEVAKGHEMNCELFKNESRAFAQNKRCANEHRQLAKWLKALRDIKNAMPDTLTTEYEAYVYHKLLEMEET